MTDLIDLHVNGKQYRVDADRKRSLLSVLRDDLELTGCKYGCGEGQCGACTVLVDGKPKRSCISHAADVNEKEITTIEGLAKNGKLHPLQEAFLQEGAFQCAYCTSGMIVSGAGLLNQNSNPTDEEIVRFMQGNICRCGTYNRIISAIKLAVKMLNEGGQ